MVPVNLLKKHWTGEGQIDKQILNGKDKPISLEEAFQKADLLVERAGERVFRILLIDVQNKQKNIIK